MTLAGGPAGGFYSEVARGVADDLLEVRAVETRGSMDNLALLEDGRVRFALAQQDVVSEYFLERQEAGEETQVRVVARVFFDYLHIFLRSPIHVERADELRRFRIWPGDQRSGTRETAVRFLESVGVLYRPTVTAETLAACGGESAAPSADEAASESGAWTQLEQCFRKGEVDVAMLMEMPGADLACRLMESGRVTLHSLNHRTLRLLTSENVASPFQRQISLANIPAHTYGNQPQAVPTVAVAVLLLARAGEQEATARRLLKAAQQTWKSLAGTEGDEGCRRLANLPAGGSLRQARLEMLEGFKADDDSLHRWETAFAIVLSLAALVGGGLWLRRHGLLRETRRVLRRETTAIRILAALAFGVMLITFLTYLFEHRTNEHFSTPWESAWSITIYLFSGLEDRNPYSTGGRVVAAFGLVLGPIFFAFLTGWLASVFIRWEKRMPHNLRDHYLILNWSPRAVRIIVELHHPLIRERKGTSVIVVLTDDEELDLKDIKKAGSGTDESFEDLYLSVGDPTAERALLNANAQDARTVLILAAERLGPHADERSIRSLFMLKRIAAEHGRRDLHVIVELADHANVPVLEEIAKDFPGLVEWVAGLEVRTRLLAQAALNRGAVGFYVDLLRVSGDTSEVYTVPIPEEAVGETFRSLASRILAAEVPVRGNGRANPGIPVGVQRQVDHKWRILCNPRPETPGWTLQRGDRLVLLAYEQPESGDLLKA